MKICSIHWYNHPIIGNFEIDLKKKDGTPYDTIVLAGENGSGKTTILNDLFTYFSGHPLQAYMNGPVADTDSRIEIEMSLNEDDEIKDASGRSIHKAKSKSHLTSNPRTNTQYFMNDGSEVKVNNLPKIPARAIYSQVAINFNVKSIRATTDIELDNTNIRSEKSSDDLATEITQLFLDIDKEDSSELAQWVDKNKGVAPPDKVQRKRIKRFTEAFKGVFGNKLEFKGVQGLSVLFEKDKREVSINQLSSGEKQIVFRSGFLLRNRGAMNSAVVLIDEPELSMHPKWQEKIFSFYRTLFLDESGLQTSQIFIATHSDHILKSALENDSTLIIVLNNEAPPEYIHKNTEGLVLKTATLAEVKWRIFDLPTTDFHDQLWAELSYDDLTNTVKKVTELDAKLLRAAAGDKSKMKMWKGYQADSTQPGGRRPNTGYNTSSLPAYIRNYLHHPEFTDINNVVDNVAYTDEELRRSITFMITLLNHT